VPFLENIEQTAATAKSLHLRFGAASFAICSCSAAISRAALAASRTDLAKYSQWAGVSGLIGPFAADACQVELLR
jgi:hypothetical protein